MKLIYSLNINWEFELFDKCKILFVEPRLSGHGGISEGLHSSNTATSGVCCPICGMPLRSCDLEAHYTQELDYLAKLSAALIVSQQNQHNVSIEHNYISTK